MSETKDKTVESSANDRGRRRTLIGLVTSDKATKTRRVEIPRQVRHERYGKILHRTTVCVAHDGENMSKTGDTVEIIETRPLSKTKNWRVVRVVTKGVSLVIDKNSEKSK
jgi:small subunit ribosomal protein S17